MPGAHNEYKKEKEGAGSTYVNNWIQYITHAIQVTVFRMPKSKLLSLSASVRPAKMSIQRLRRL